MNYGFYISELWGSLCSRTLVDWLISRSGQMSELFLWTGHLDKALGSASLQALSYLTSPLVVPLPSYTAGLNCSLSLSVWRPTFLCVVCQSLCSLAAVAVFSLVSPTSFSHLTLLDLALLPGSPLMNCKPFKKDFYVNKCLNPSGLSLFVHNLFGTKFHVSNMLQPTYIYMSTSLYVGTHQPK